MEQEKLSSAKAETEKPSYWAVLPASVRYDPELPPMARLLYAEISSLTESRGFCYASNDYFVRLYGMAERTLQRHLKALEDAGYIQILDGNGGKARRRIFAGVNPLAGNPDKNDGVTPTKMSGPPDKNVTQNRKENRKENDPPKAPQGAAWEPQMFERFWKLYPRKRDKLKALRAWDKLKADRKLMQTMSAALKAQMATEEWQRDNGRAIPYPSTWINNRRWEDELEGRAAEGGGPYGQSAQAEEEALPWI